MAHLLLVETNQPAWRFAGPGERPTRVRAQVPDLIACAHEARGPNLTEDEETHQEGGGVAAKYIFAGLAALFIVMGLARGGPSHPQSRTWLLVGVIFGAVAAWLFSQS